LIQQPRSAEDERMGERQQIDFDIDATISEIPGLEGLHLLEDVLDDALARVPTPKRARPEPAVLAGV
jgi:hypothetical protein